MCLNTSFLKVICHSKYLLALRVTMFCSILNIVDPRKCCTLCNNKTILAFFWSSLKPICIQLVAWITLKAYFIKLDFQFDNHWTRSIYFEISYLSGKVLHVFEKNPYHTLTKSNESIVIIKKTWCDFSEYVFIHFFYNVFFFFFA